MNQVGRDAWHLHMQYIVDGVTRFVNHMNHNYTGEGIGMNPTQFQNFLFPGLPPAINTRVYNNAFEISIGIMSSSLDREDLNDVHNSAIEDIEDPTDDDDDDGAEGAVGVFQFIKVMLPLHIVILQLMKVVILPVHTVILQLMKVMLHLQVVMLQLLRLHHVHRNVSKQKNSCGLYHQQWKNHIGTCVKKLTEIHASCPISHALQTLQ